MIKMEKRRLCCKNVKKIIKDKSEFFYNSPGDYLEIGFSKLFAYCVDQYS